MSCVIDIDNGYTKCYYDYKDGVIIGDIVGQTLRGKYTQSDGNKGTVNFKFNSNFSAFTGTYKNDGSVFGIGEGKWNGNRK